MIVNQSKSHSQKIIRRNHHHQPTIGFLFDTLGQYSLEIWSGITDVAIEQNINLISFRGGILGLSDNYNVQGNIIYELAHKDTIDGLIILSASMNGYLPNSQLKNFYEQYHSLPIVSIADSLENASCVVIDNGQGMRTLLAHLIEFHAYTRIAFVKGPEENLEAQQRYQAYTSTLAEYGLPLNPDLIASGSFSPKSGIEAVNHLLNRNQTNIDVIVAANDEMALGILSELNARGILVPSDIALAGFDDIHNSRYTSPPLTTVKQPLYQQGRQAAEIVLAKIKGHPVPNQVSMPTELVIRQSCGCLSQAVSQVLVTVTYTGQELSLNTLTKEQKAQILATIREELTTISGTKNEALHTNWVEQMLESFLVDLHQMHKHQPVTFLQLWDNILRQEIQGRNDISRYQNVLSTMRQCLLPFILDKEELNAAENLWHQVRILIGEAIHVAQTNQIVKAHQEAGRMRRFSRKLMSMFDLQKLVDILAQELPLFDINQFYLALYEDPASPLISAQLMLAYDNAERKELPTTRVKFPTRQILPEGLLSSKKRFNLLLQPLYFRDEQLGYILHEITHEIAANNADLLRTLRREISNTLKGDLLMQQIQMYAVDLESKIDARTAELRHEINEHKRTEIALQEANAMLKKLNDDKDKFISILAHDLRSPLTPLLLRSQMMAQQASSLETKKIEEISRAIHQSTQQISNLLESLLKWVKLQRGYIIYEPRKLDLTQIFSHNIALLSENALNKNISLNNQLSQSLLVYADEQMLNLVIRNLLSNAIKFTLPGGEVTVSAESKDNSLIKIAVSDNGVGIDQGALDNLFKPTVHYKTVGTAHEKGAGLGLIICREMILLHGGSIWIDSQLGSGTTVYITIPVADNAIK